MNTTINITAKMLKLVAFKNSESATLKMSKFEPINTAAKRYPNT